MPIIGENHSGVGDAGKSFNYAQWTKDTVISLCSVPWSSDYRDIVRFPNHKELDRYLDARTYSHYRLDGLMRHKQGEPINLPIPFEVAQNVNYLRVENPAQPLNYPTSNGRYGVGHITPPVLYYFVQNVVYVSPNNTELVIQLDVWSTYFHRITPGMGYVERGHVGIANRDHFLDYGRTHLTVPEGLDIGNEYVIKDSIIQMISAANNNEPDKYAVLVWSATNLKAHEQTKSLDERYGTVSNPKLATARGTDFQNVPNGASAWYFPNVKQFTDFMASISDRPWVSQGIISIMAIPNMSRYGNTTRSINYVNSDWPVKQKVNKLGPANWRETIDLGPYSHLKKFLTYPYCVLELTANTGTPVIIKPENWQLSQMEIVETPYFALPAPRIEFYPLAYNSGQNNQRVYNDVIINDGGEGRNMATGIFSFPTFSSVNNGYLTSMASQAHSIAFQHQSADWSQQKALTGNQLSYDQASAGMNLANTQAGIQAHHAGLATDQAAAHAWQKTGLGGLSSVASGAAVGGGVGALGGLAAAGMSAAGTAIDTNNMAQQTAISNSRLHASTRANVANAGYVRDTNKSYADFAARGDYSNSIAAINARVQDAKLTQPTTSGQVGGDAFLLSMHYWGYEVRVKMLNPGAMRTIGDYWLRYGYAINRFVRPPVDFHVMQKFTYWKFQQFYLTATEIPHVFTDTIRGIFEKGVTVWRNPDDIPQQNIYDNKPIVKDYY